MNTRVEKASSGNTYNIQYLFESKTVKLEIETSVCNIAG